MQNTVGEYIRQLRRQHSLTQSELGADRYSKSYISAIERGSVTPSREALHFFAGQLNLSEEHFEQLIQQMEQKNSPSLFSLSPTFFPGNDLDQEEVKTLVEFVHTGTKLYAVPLVREFISPPPDVLATFPLAQQASYAFMKGLQAQENGKYFEALPALEYALALAPAQYQSPILDALGLNYYLLHQYETALQFHQRALRAFRDDRAQTGNADLLLMIELHCGFDCQALSFFHQAYQHFDHARQSLRATHNMKVAAQIYRGLGYCMYAMQFQSQTVASPQPAQCLSPEQERALQKAVSYQLQSRTLYQASHDVIGESEARLLQAMILLDYTSWKYQALLEHSTEPAVMTLSSCNALLDEADEQCRQILLNWQEVRAGSSAVSEQETIIYTALAYLIRVYAQRATIARLGEHTDKVILERSHAASLCQQVLDTFSETALPWHKVHTFAVFPNTGDSLRDPSLPSLPNMVSLIENSSHSYISLAEVLFASGEVAEELATSTTNLNYISLCQSRANLFFQFALSLMNKAIQQMQRDSSYPSHWQQRCLQILEQRLQTSPESAVESALPLLNTLKELLSSPPSPRSWILSLKSDD